MAGLESLLFNVRLGSGAVLGRYRQVGLLLGVNQTKSARKRTCRSKVGSRGQSGRALGMA
jgi:hypothetical protein